MEFSVSFRSSSSLFGYSLAWGSVSSMFGYSCYSGHVRPLEWPQVAASGLHLEKILKNSSSVFFQDLMTSLLSILEKGKFHLNLLLL